MKRTMIVLMALIPAVAVAGERLMAGFSGSVIESKQLPEAQQKLERQGQSGGPEESELSAQIYVDSQARMAETFRRPVPKKMTQQTRSGN